MKILSCFFFGVLISSAAVAAPYHPVSIGESSGVNFEIGYTAGTHEGHAQISGTVDLNPETLEIFSASFSVPVKSMDSGNAKRDCHIRESLGINYIGSVYPQSHACNGKNQLPTDGPNSVAYPEMKFTFVTVTAGIAKGSFEMHGVKKDIEIPLKLTKDAEGRVMVKSDFDLKLNDYGVVVKPFLVITTADVATVHLNLLLIPTPLR
ncbi:MAG: YceI family protein [Cryobacterium sp.]|nr:YceI family protein [Oligoflexia bacterium]